jgi:ABC-type nitrate/sulfonate/bicarbonate transport system permease component
VTRFPDGRALGFLLVAGLLLTWEAASLARLLNPFYFPPVHQVVRSLVGAVLDGSLGMALFTSLGRGFAGYSLAAILGVGLGAVAGQHLFVRQLIDPVVEFLRPLPSPAIIPLAILLLGIGSSMKVFIIAWACFFPILLNTIDGVRGVPPALIETARNFGLRYAASSLTVVLPAAMPAIFTGLRIALAVMLILTVVTEMIAGNNGIGFLLLEAERTFRIADMYGFIIALGLVGYVLNRLFQMVDRRVLAWHYAMHQVPAP